MPDAFCTFTVTVTDVTGNIQSDTIHIDIADPITYDKHVQYVFCNGEATGSIVIQSNGTGNYNYLWDNNATTSELLGLSPGMYHLTIEDTNACFAIDTFFTSEPAPMEINILATNPVSGNDGAINLVISGGTAPYTILWDNGSTGQAIYNLSDGLYNFVVTDGNGCSSNGSVELAFVNSSEELKSSGITIFPNPSTGILYLESEVKVTVFDLLGNQLLTEVNTITSPAHHSNIDLSHLAQCVYLICCKDLSLGLLWIERISIVK